MLQMILSVLIAPVGLDVAVMPLERAHAHNDYYHERPLLDALQHGFCSVEADIFLVDGQLLVGHDRSELRAERTLQRLYLDPLRERIEANNGSVYGDEQDFTLFIDIKSQAESTYRALSQALARYSKMLTTVEAGQVSPGAINVVVSGNRASQVIAADSPRFCGIDGRLTDLNSTSAAHLMPFISDHWGNNFKWQGEGEMPAGEREKLRGIVRQAHDAGRRVRFWATPENESLWRQLVAADVDLINTDQLARLQAFLGDTAPN